MEMGTPLLKFEGVGNVVPAFRRRFPEALLLADMKTMVPKTMTACFALIERDMLRGPWVMGEQYTVCDPYLYTIGLWLEGDSVDVSALPKVLEHRRRMSERPAVQKVLAEEKS